MHDVERLRTIQRKLARAERKGDNLTMAEGYLLLAGELLKVGDHRLGSIFIERAGECLAWMETSPSFRD